MRKSPSRGTKCKLASPSNPTATKKAKIALSTAATKSKAASAAKRKADTTETSATRDKTKGKVSDSCLSKKNKATLTTKEKAFGVLPLLTGNYRTSTASRGFKLLNITCLNTK